MNKERLLTLANFLETVRPEKFNMALWGSDKECGAAGCACGWAAQIPEFKTLGLHLDASETESLVLAYGELYGFRAAQDFFGFGLRTETYKLFDPSCYQTEDGAEYNPTPHEVAERIRETVAAAG